MNVKTNVRAGKQNRGTVKSTSSTPEVEVEVPSYPVPVLPRCLPV